MDAKLSKIGDDWAVVIDQSLLDALDITAETALSVTTDGESIVIVPEDLEHRKRFEQALNKIHQQYGGMLKRLADS
jgi:antitoxin component of MazEF toxin-antitoxin module